MLVMIQVLMAKNTFKRKRSALEELSEKFYSGFALTSPQVLSNLSFQAVDHATHVNQIEGSSSM